MVETGFSWCSSKRSSTLLRSKHKKSTAIQVVSYKYESET